jgi:MFS family permease
MIVLDTTIVNVALPSIKKDLGFSETSLAWVVNSYLLTFGGFLLLGGRLGDLLGHRRVFLAGIVLFTLASLACGAATAQGTLVAARLIQGFGGAVVSAVSLSLMVSLFQSAWAYSCWRFESCRPHVRSAPAHALTSPGRPR